MLIRLASLLVVMVLIAGAGLLYGPVGALAALPVAFLISFLIERLISRVQPDQSLKAQRRRR